MMGLDNPLHIAVLLILVLLVFGAKRLPEIGQSLGAGLRGFKESISGETPTTPIGAPGVGDPIARVTAASVDMTTPSQAAPSATELPVERTGSILAG